MIRVSGAIGKSLIVLKHKPNNHNFLKPGLSLPFLNYLCSYLVINETYSMINSILLTDFTGFANTRFDFTKGINVLIGKNGTGKTHVLKCLAATLQARHDFLGKNSASKEQFEYILAEDMIFYFKPDVIGNLVNKGVPSGRANITVTIDGKLLQYSFSSASKTTVKLETDEKWDDRHFIYIPPREMFSLFEGFIGLSSKREISFDQTYINLAHALSLPILRESEDNPLKPAIELLEQELQFKVLQMNGRFYIQTEKGTWKRTWWRKDSASWLPSCTSY